MQKKWDINVLYLAILNIDGFPNGRREVNNFDNATPIDGVTITSEQLVEVKKFYLKILRETFDSFVKEGGI